MSYLFWKVQRINRLNTIVINRQQSILLVFLFLFEHDSAGYWKSIANNKQIGDDSTDFECVEGLPFTLRVLIKNIHHFQHLLYKLSFGNTSHKETFQPNILQQILILFFVVVVFLVGSEVDVMKREVLGDKVGITSIDVCILVDVD